MYRLACLEEANVALGREQLRQHALEQVNDDGDDGDDDDDEIVHFSFRFLTESRVFTFLDIPQ